MTRLFRDPLQGTSEPADLVDIYRPKWFGIQRSYLKPREAPPDQPTSHIAFHNNDIPDIMISNEFGNVTVLADVVAKEADNKVLSDLALQGVSEFWHRLKLKVVVNWK